MSVLLAQVAAVISGLQTRRFTRVLLLFLKKVLMCVRQTLQNLLMSNFGEEEKVHSYRRTLFLVGRYVVFRRRP